MMIETGRFGRTEIDPESILTFTEGLLGFEELHRFAIILSNNTEPIQWLQAVDDPMVSLPIINPFLIKPDYELDVDDAELGSIGNPASEDVLVVSVTVIPEDIRQMTVNLSAPILINLKNRRARQIIMEYNQPNSIRYPAFAGLVSYYQELEKAETEDQK
ncbi:MAG: flagellar assembly protein FliW [Clostridia bacterium]|nr:flagellar assembly protein FliW [Clostridia bacterium]